MVFHKVSGGSMSFTKWLFAAGWVFCVLATSLWAQTTATMTGSVKDSSGAIVPEATITIKHIETGSARTIQTDDGGNYRVPALRVGQYEVTAEKSGFKMLV